MLAIAVRNYSPTDAYCLAGGTLLKLLLFCVLFVMCWPIALVALVLYPIVWLLLLPFRIVGIAVDGVLELVAALFTLPVRLIRAI